MTRPLLLPFLGLTLLLGACATPPAPAPGEIFAPLEKSPAPVSPPVRPPAPPVTVPVAPVASEPVARVPATPAGLGEKEGRQLLDRLLPARIPARSQWSQDIMTAFTQLRIPYTPQFFCAVLAVAEQESNFNPDPVIPNLGKIARGEIEKRARKYLVPPLAITAALAKTSPDGRSYNQRLDSLRTKREMNALFGDLIRELPFGEKWLADKNPIRDGGPMQVSVAFAETQVRAWPYPYPYKSLREEVFSPRGSVYFGTAILLQYAAPYKDMVYRFADYNAGRYSSRNAAFQQALSVLAGHKLALDGDLMLYRNKMNREFSGQASESQQAALALAGKLGMDGDAIVRDLKQEKLASFGQTALYRTVFEKADARAGRKLPREIIPQIVLDSPKFTRTLTTEWFARRVDGRYRTCLARGGYAP